MQLIFTPLRGGILLIPGILYLLPWGLYRTGIIWQSDCKMFISWTVKWEGRKYSLFAWPCSFVIFHLEKILSFLRMLTNTFCSTAGLHPHVSPGWVIKHFRPNYFWKFAVLLKWFFNVILDCRPEGYLVLSITTVLSPQQARGREYLEFFLFTVSLWLTSLSERNQDEIG